MAGDARHLFASRAMVGGRSRMKQAESAAHSSGRSGGDSRVFDFPGAGVLQTMATAMVPHVDGSLSGHDDGAPARCSQIEEQVRRHLRARPKAAAGRRDTACPRPRSRRDARSGSRRRRARSRASRFDPAATAIAARSPPLTRIESMPPKPPLICRSATSWPGWVFRPG